MRLVPTSSYFKAADYLSNHNLISRTRENISKVLNKNLTSLSSKLIIILLSYITLGKKIVFFGSEDPAALRAAQEWSSENDWILYYANLFERDAVEGNLIIIII